MQGIKNKILIFLKIKIELIIFNNLLLISSSFLIDHIFLWKQFFNKKVIFIEITRKNYLFGCIYQF